jgi:hypothetical protein
VSNKAYKVPEVQHLLTIATAFLLIYEEQPLTINSDL